MTAAFRYSHASRIPNPGLGSHVNAACSSILLLGEDNPQAPNDSTLALWDEPLGGATDCAGLRLRSNILGVSSELYRALWRANLCRSAWSLAQADERARTLTSVICPWDVVVLLGRKVADRVGKRFGIRIPTLTRRLVEVDSPTGGYTFCLIMLPHPSGRCRDWNDPTAYESARNLLRKAAPGIPWGEA